MSLKYIDKQIKEKNSHIEYFENHHKSYKKEKKMIHKYHRQKNKNISKELTPYNRYSGGIRYI